jgi:N-acetylglucosaminyldiphosphoundecaprenol N-acetyl-beta-D-mannosaminyltransferase
MECHKNEKVLTSVNSADLVTPDGMPVVWLGRLMGYNNIRRVYGPDLMREICRISEIHQFKNYFYGSSLDVLTKLKAGLNRKYPDLIIGGIFSPPFRQLTVEEDDKIVEEINNCNPDIVWVGLGSPKQDLWMYEHRGKVNAPVIIGVGAAFDFLAGTKPQAPRWMRNSGFEWFFRFITEPKRLWRRYLIDNSLFIYYVGIELFRKVFSSQKSKL